MKKLISLLLIFTLLLPSFTWADANASYRTSSDPKKGSYFYLEQLNVLCAGVMGASIISNCTQYSLSTIAYMGGSVAYLLSEMITAKKVNDAHKKNIQDLTLDEKKLKEMPLESLKTAKATEEERRDGAKARRDWMTAVSVIYGVAMALAIVEVICENSPAAIWCSSLPDTQCNGRDSGTGKMIASGISMAYMSFLKNDWGGIFGKVGENNTVGTIMSIAMPIAMQAFMSQLQTIAQPIPRTVIFGVNFGLTVGATVNVANLVKKYDENVSLVDKMINQFQETQTSNDGIAEGPTVTPSNEEQTEMKISVTNKYLANNEIEGSKRCSSFGAKSSILTNDCSKPTELNLKTLPANFQVDLSNGLKASVNMANKLLKGDYVGAKMDAAELKGMSGKIGAINERLKEELHKVMKEKDPKFSLDKMIAEEAQKHQDTLVGALNQAGVTNNSLLTSADAKALENKKEIDTKKDLSVARKVEEAQAPQYVADLSQLSDEPIHETGKQLDFENLDKFAVEEKDIHKKKDESLFEYISNRYKRSYEKLFKRIQ